MTNGTCSIDGCERKLAARGWCATHYMRWRKYGDVNANFGPKRDHKPLCAAEDCDLISQGWHGYCNKHYLRVKRYGDPAANNRKIGRAPCTIEGCEGLNDGKGLCAKHWARNKKNGSPHIVKPVPAWDQSPQWRGQDAGYQAIHWRLRNKIGKASGMACVDCGAQAREWSYDGLDPNQLFEGSLAYSLEPVHYQPRCKQCHVVHDLAK